MNAVVYKSTGSWYDVKDEQGIFRKARLKGRLKIDGFTSTNPVAVGDRVSVEQEENADTLVITDVLPRKNYITRLSPQNKNQHHIVASNLDQAFLFATIKNPRTSSGFIDRFLITAEAYHIPAVIIFNKCDIYGAKDIERLNEVTDIYENAGYKVVALSLRTEKGLEEIKQLMKGKITLLSGHSGVGKSTFINTVFPDFSLKTQDVSDWSGKGMHTTTFAEMFDPPDSDGKIIDTPGLREFALAGIEKEELSHYFPEMRARIHDCKFNNCLHENEPGCAIKKAVAEGLISEERYVNYLTVLHSE